MKPNGARKAIAEAISSEWFATETRKRCRRTEAGGRRLVTERVPSGTLAVLISACASGVVDPAPRVPEDDRGHGERDNEQHHRERAGVAHEVVHERRLVEQDGVEERRVLRVTQVVDRVACLRGLAGGDVGGDVGLREVLEPLDHAEDDREQDDGADRRQRHVPKPSQRPGAVELGRLVQVLRDVENRREEDDHRVPDAPDLEERQRRLRPAGRLEPQRPVDPEVAEDDVHRPVGRVQEVDEAERCCDRRREGGEVEDRPEEAEPELRAREHERDPERERHLERDRDRDEPERVADAGPELRVVVEEVVVVRKPAPLRRGQQVVMGEGEVPAHYERVPEEDREAGEPGGHQQEDEAATAPRRSPPGSPACGRRQAGRLGDRALAHGTPPPAWALTLSTCLPTVTSPWCRFFTLPACHFTVKRPTSVFHALPAAVIGAVAECGLLKIRTKVAKRGSGLSSGECPELRVDGTLRIPFENFASAWSFVVSQRTSSHAWSTLWPPFGMPMIVPFTAPAPYRFLWASSTGIGAVP